MLHRPVTVSAQRLVTPLAVSWLSYRALFSWLNPLGYVSSRLLKPVGLTLGFSSIGHSAGFRVDYLLIGTSLLSCVTAFIFGASLAVGNERSYGTLDLWLASPAHFGRDLSLRLFPHAVDAVVSGIITFTVACAIFGKFPISILTYSAAAVLVVAASVGIALAVAASAVIVKDMFVVPNAAQLVLMIAGAGLVPVSLLPPPVELVSRAIPLRYVIDFIGVNSGNGWQYSHIGHLAACAAAWMAIGMATQFLFFSAARRAMQS